MSASVFGNDRKAGFGLLSHLFSENRFLKLIHWLDNTFNGTAGLFFFNQIGSTSKGNGFNFKRILVSRTIKSVA